MNRTILIYSLGEKGYNLVKHLIDSGYKSSIEAIVVGSDKNVQNDYSKALNKLCFQNDIEVLERTQEINSTSNYWFAVGWRWIINFPSSTKLIVFHDSILPKYRGFAPLVNQLINGEEHIGVTALLATGEFDTGPVILQEKTEIAYPIKIQAAIEKASILYNSLAENVVRMIQKDGNLNVFNQDESKATYSLWRDEEDYQIDWNLKSKRIKRMVDALGYPYTGAVSYLNNRKVIIEEVESLENLEIENRTPGKVLKIENGHPIIVCKRGLIKIISAHYEDDQASILPLKKFRSKFN